MKKTLLQTCFLLIIAAVAQVAQAQGIALSPVIMNQRFTPGKTFSIDMTLSNSTDKPLLMRGVSTDLWFDPSTNDRTLPAPGTTERSAANWVEFIPNEVLVPAKGESVVRVIVTPRLNTSGGYYAALFFESVPKVAKEADEQSGAIYVNFRIGGLLLLTAQGSEQYSVDINDFRVTAPDAAHPLTAQFAVDNKSNTHVFPRVQMAVLDATKKLVGKANGDWQRFMPGQKKDFVISYPGALTPGSYEALLTIVHEGGQVLTRSIPFRVQGE